MVTTTYVDGTFGVREIGGRTDSAGTAVDDLPLEQDALINAILTQGYLTDGAFEVSADSPASMDVTVGSGAAKADIYVVETDETGRHPYLVRLDDASITVTLDAADASNPRIDEIWLVVRDPALSGDAGSLALPRIAYRKGDAGTSPSAPGADSAWAASVKLATVTVGAGVTSITAGNITDNRSEALLATGLPVGAIQMYAASSAPNGWLSCDGSEVSRTTYARLFAAVGTTFGAGDGSTTFNLPDLDGRFPVGAGTLGSDTYTVGGTGGEAKHTLTSAEMPAHDHEIRYAHYGTTPANGTAGGRGYVWEIGDTANDNSTGDTQSVGSGSAHENRPPYIGLRFIIFAAA